MIKTVPFDVITNFLIGLLAALACRRGAYAQKSLVWNRYLLGLVLFELFFFLPLGAYLYFFYPDWSLMYFVDPGALAENTRRLAGVLALAGYLGAIVGGFLLGARLIRAGRDKTALMIFLAAGLALAVFSLVTYRQLLNVGTYADWSAMPRTTAPLYAHRIGYIIGVYAAAGGVAFFLMIRNFLRDDPAS